MGDSIIYCEKCENQVGCHMARQCFLAKEQAEGPLDATACSLRGKANAAWNKLNFALSLLHHGGAHLQATTLIVEARELCDEIVHDPRAENDKTVPTAGLTTTDS